MPKSGQPWDPARLGQSALLDELRSLAEPLLGRPRWPTLQEYTEFAEQERRVRAATEVPMRFAPARQGRRRRSAAGPALAELYDGRIALEREIPCLESSYHDLFNALVWAAFPRSKRAIHQRQFRALEGWLPAGAVRLPNRRTREQDALTLFDEGGSVLVQSSAPCEASGEGRGAPRQQLILFGHALMEHVCFETRAVRSAALRVALDATEPELAGRALLERIDRALCRRLLDPRELSAPDFDAVVAIDPPDAWRVLPL